MRLSRPVRAAAIVGIALVLAAVLFVLVSYRHPPLTFTGGRTTVSGKAESAAATTEDNKEMTK